MEEQSILRKLIREELSLIMNQESMDEVNTLLQNNSKERKEGVSDININVRMNSGKKKWEDEYKLQSFYIHKDLLVVLNNKAQSEGKGAKTFIVNEALKNYLNESNN